MTRTLNLFSAICFFLVPAVAGGAAYQWQIPSWMVPPPDAVTATMSDSRVALGRALFYDTRLSIDGTMSCASCHRQDKAFTDGEVTHRGVHGDVGLRNAPSVVNLAYMPVLSWANPNLKSVEVQVLIPLFGNAPVEMGMTGKEKALFAKLNRDCSMRERLRAAFPGKTGFDMEALTGGLASFVRSIVSFSSSYDRYKRLGDADAISPSAKHGEELFFGEKMECSHCHSGPTFSDNFQSRALPFPGISFHNTGLYNEDGLGAYPSNNHGVRDITGRPPDEGKFRTPSLRNVALTAPYMHDGSVATLPAVIRDHYAKGGRAATGPNGRSPLRDPLITGFSATDEDTRDLVAFLESLTDDNLLTNPAYSAPAHSPRCTH